MALLAQYSFDLGTGTAITDKSYSSRNLSLTANGAWVTGHTLNAIGVIGTTQASASGTVTLPSLTAFTVMGWVKMQTFGFNSLLLIDDGSGNNRIRLAIGGSQALHLQVTTSAGSAWVFTDDTVISNIPPFAWDHVAVSWDGLNFYIYLNGTSMTLSFSGSATAAGSITDATRLFVGGDSGIGNSTWDDVRVYDEFMNAAAVTTLMNTPVPNSNIYLADGSEAEGTYLWNGTTLETTELIKS